MLLDTNILVYASKSDGEWLSPWTQHPAAALASVSRIEALGFAKLDAEEEAAIRSILSACLEYPLDEGIIERAIALRQQKAMKLGDSIIAATALEFGLPLVTRNDSDFAHIEALQVVNPFSSA